MAKLPATDRMPASVAKYVLSSLSNRVKLFDAKGSVVANVSRAN